MMLIKVTQIGNSHEIINMAAVVNRKHTLNFDRKKSFRAFYIDF